MMVCSTSLAYICFRRYATFAASRRTSRFQTESGPSEELHDHFLLGLNKRSRGGKEWKNTR